MEQFSLVILEAGLNEYLFVLVIHSFSSTGNRLEIFF